MQKTLSVVFQTHWDREWYQSFETYRYRLIHVIRRVLEALDQDEISTFVLDGQTLPLKDYLEVCEPHEKSRILSYIKAGKIVIGPWYIAADEFLVHGESLIRNLELGHDMAKQYGEVQKVGYIPDTFGHIGQMPQILKGFDIDNAMMWRGVLPKHTEFIWQGVDQTNLFSIFLKEGYYQPLINQDDFMTAIASYHEKLAPFGLTSHVLLTAGGDHVMPVKKDLKSRIKDIKDTLKTDVIVCDFETYIDQVKKDIDHKKLEVISGELRSNENSYILPNVLSTRSYLKINNQMLEDLMLGQIEPLVAKLYKNKTHAPIQYINHIWELILQNQPHDSICGCSIDPVHLDNEARSRWALESIEALKQGIYEETGLHPFQYYASTSTKIYDDDEKCMIFNPHPYPFEGWVDLSLFLHKDKPHHQGFQIMDGVSKDTLDFALLGTNNQRMFKTPLDYPPGFRAGTTYDLKVYVKIKPLSFHPIYLEPSSHFEKNLIDDDHAIENEYLKVTLNDDGTLHILDKQHGITYDKTHTFYSSIDCGDSYNYSKPDFDVTTTAQLSKKGKVSIQNHVKSLTYQLLLHTPKGLNDDRKSLDLNNVDTYIDVTITLSKNQSFLDIETIIDNQSKDQRLRVSYPMNEIIEHTISDSAFELKKRQANRKELFEAPKQKEVPVVVDPSLSMIYIKTKRSGFWIGHRGLHEYQTVLEDEKTTLHHTLIRSVGYLSHDDFKSRGGAAGPNMPTPDAQVLRKVKMHYQLGIVLDHQSVESIYQQVQEIRKPPFYCPFYIHDAQDQSLISISNRAIHMTSLRYISEHRIEVRLWNTSHHNQLTFIKSDDVIESLVETNMLKQHKADVSDKLQFKPNEIKTIQVSIKKHSASS